MWVISVALHDTRWWIMETRQVTPGWRQSMSPRLTCRCRDTIFRRPRTRLETYIYFAKEDIFLNYCQSSSRFSSHRGHNLWAWLGANSGSEFRKPCGSGCGGRQFSASEHYRPSRKPIGSLSGPTLTLSPLQRLSLI